MDILFLHLLILSISSFLLFSFLSKKLSGPKNLPPGRTGWPVMGEMWDFVMTTRRGTPEKFVRDRMEKYSGDVFKTRLLGQKMVVFCGAAGNKFLFSSENKYLTTWWPAVAKKIVSFPEDEEDYLKLSSQVRISLLDILKPEALRLYVPIMDSVAKQQVETNWYPFKEVKVFQLAKTYTFDLACNLFMNVKDPEHRERLKAPFLLIIAGLFSMPIDLPGTACRRAINAGKTIREELLAIVKERKKEMRENPETKGVDVLSRLLQLEDTDHAKEKHIVNVIAGLFLSYDTMSIAITFIIYFVAKYPHVYDMVFQEQMGIANSKSEGEMINWDDVQKMRYSWWVACEAMRLYPPGSGTFREAIADFTFAGFTIPKGWKTFWTPNSTHRDPKYFPKPEEFDPSRFEGRGPAPFSYVPFGGGPRMCPGKEYARLAILVFLHNLVTKFKFKTVNPLEKIVYTPNPIPVDGLLVQLTSVDN